MGLGDRPSQPALNETLNGINYYRRDAYWYKQYIKVIYQIKCGLEHPCAPSVTGQLASRQGQDYRIFIP